MTLGRFSINRLLIIFRRCWKFLVFFFFSSRRRHTRYWRDWSSDVCSSDLLMKIGQGHVRRPAGVDRRHELVEVAVDAGQRSESRTVDLGNLRRQVTQGRTPQVRRHRHPALGGAPLKQSQLVKLQVDLDLSAPPGGVERRSAAGVSSCHLTSPAASGPRLGAPRVRRPGVFRARRTWLARRLLFYSIVDKTGTDGLN